MPEPTVPEAALAALLWTFVLAGAVFLAGVALGEIEACVRYCGWRDWVTLAGVPLALWALRKIARWGSWC